jgi:hypothetical protein
MGEIVTANSLLSLVGPGRVSSLWSAIQEETLLAMKRLIVPPAGPPGPIPGDPSATEPPKSHPDRTLVADPNELPPPSTGTESLNEEKQEP